MNAWTDLIAAVERSRDRQARYYKPACLFAVAELVDEKELNPTRIAPEPVLERFGALVDPLFPRSSDRGFLPLWHLSGNRSNNRAWIWYNKADRAVPRTAFRSEQPKSKRQFLLAVEYAAVPPETARLWLSSTARQELKAEIVSMLLHDADVPAQQMGAHLAGRFRRPGAPYRQDDLIAPGEFPEGARYVEDYDRYRAHKRIERRQELVSAAKRIHGYTCAICGFNFERGYGAVGKDYIEAHHLVPVATRKGTRAKLDPRTDFVVLCANCHRMVHRAGLPSDLDEFRKQHTMPEYLRWSDNGRD